MKLTVLVMTLLLTACEERPEGPIVVPLSDVGVDVGGRSEARSANLTRYPIPDADPSGVSAPNPLVDLRSGAPSELSVSVELVHPDHSELTLTLVSPAGTQVLLRNRVAGDGVLEETFTELAPFFADDARTEGTWNLVVVDDALGNLGELVGWEIALRL